jgi:serine/threonine protein kinase
MSSERKQIGSYRVIRVLGSGGMGTVYEAQHLQISRRVAIKLLHTEFLEQRDLAERFLNEARAVNEINHPGVIRIFDADKLEDGTLYLVMELLSGQTLAAYLHQQKTMPMSVLLDVAYQLAETLRAAHSRMIVHRDLKPDNIMLLPDLRRASELRTKILDFGIAKLTLALGGGKTMSDYLGTPKYSAPEQVQNPSTVDEKADVYSLGCILYECAAGVAPFEAETPLDLMCKQLYSTPARLNTLTAHIGVELADLIDEMLDKDRSKRPNMDQVLAALREVRERCAFETVVRLDPRQLAPGLPWSELGSREPILSAEHSIGFSRSLVQSQDSLSEHVGAGVSIPCNRRGLLGLTLLHSLRRSWRFVVLGGAAMTLLMLVYGAMVRRSQEQSEQIVRQTVSPVVERVVPSPEDSSAEADGSPAEDAPKPTEDRPSSTHNIGKKPRRAGKGEPSGTQTRKAKRASVF